MLTPCSELREGHRHCKHGHMEDCPDRYNCELLPREDDKQWPPKNLETK